MLINLPLSAQDLSVDTDVNNADFVQQFPATDAVVTTNGSGMIVTTVPAQGVVVFVR